MIYVFGNCELDEGLYELRRSGMLVKLEPQVFKVLTYLLQHRDRVVPKDELLAKLWPGEFVTDSALTRCIVQARHAVHDDGTAQRVIKTIYRHGYRFVAAVETRTSVAAADAPSAVRSPTDEPAALLSPSTMPQADTTGAGHLSRKGERKQVTVLDAGVRGLTALAQGHDPETWHEMLTRLFDVLRAEVQRVEGLVSQVTGEELIALFGAPIAQEDHAVRALHAALGMQRAFAAFAAELRGPQALTLTLRLGVHSGPVLVTPIGDDEHMNYAAEGFAVHLARRLQEHATDGTIYVSEAVRRQAAGFLRFDDLGVFTLPEVAQPVHVYTCMPMDQGHSRLEAFLQRHTSMFLGRKREMERLDALWSRVRRGQGQVVCLVGEAGVGKSRLAYEFQRTLPDARTLQAQTLSYGQSMPYHPFIPLLRALLDLHAQDPPTDQRQQIRAHLHVLHPTLAEDEPWLSHLLDVPLAPDRLPDLAPEERKRRLQQLCLRLLVPQAADRPLCLLIEDLHWLDPSSQEVLDLLVAALARLPVLLLATTRPGFHHSWDDLTYYHRLIVEPLAEEHIDALISDYFQSHDVSSALKALLRERTGGNPFFLEELLRTLHDQQLIVRQADGYGLTTGVHLDLPSSIHSVLAARIDRLAPEEKRLLQTAAVIGHQVPWLLLQAIADLSEVSLDRSLVHLQSAEFLYETRLSPEREYTFKHALTHEVAYQSLLTRTRQQYHQRTAQVLAERFPDLAETQPELLAQHYTAAGLAEEAVAYWQRAGERSRARSADVEAVAHLTQGLDVLRTLPATPRRDQHELDLQLMLGRALAVVKGFAAPETGHAYARARDLCRQVGDPARLFAILVGLREFYLNRGELHTARELAEACLPLAQRQHDPAPLMRAHFGLGSILYNLGELVPARAHLAQAIALYTPQQDRSLIGQAPLGVPCFARAALTLWRLGYPDQALARSDEMLALAQELADAYNLARALVYAADVHHLRREASAAQRQAEASLALSTVQAFVHWVGPGTFWRGWALAAQGQGEEGMAQMQQGLAARQATGNMASRAEYLALLAEAYGGIGQAEEGLRLLAEALVVMDQTGSRHNEPELYRIKGELLRRQAVPDESQAAACFQQALATARRQQAKSWELRAAMSLSRLWQPQGKRAEAHDLLAPLYGWFTEGFDTADLQEAKALLEELS